MLVVQIEYFRNENFEKYLDDNKNFNSQLFPIVFQRWLKQFSINIVLQTQSCGEAI